MTNAQRPGFAVALDLGTLVFVCDMKNAIAGAKLVLVPPSLPQQVFLPLVQTEFQKRLDFVGENTKLRTATGATGIAPGRGSHYHDFGARNGVQDCKVIVTRDGMIPRDVSGRMNAGAGRNAAQFNGAVQGNVTRRVVALHVLARVNRVFAFNVVNELSFPLPHHLRWRTILRMPRTKPMPMTMVRTIVAHPQS